MMTYQISRIEITGKNKGELSVFANNLPGFPNNISLNARGTYWLALSAPRSPDIENLQTNPLLRKVLMRLPEAFLVAPKPAKYGFAVELDRQGRILSSIQDTSGKQLFMLTSITEHKDSLYLGSISDNVIKQLPAVLNIEYDGL